MIFKETLRSHLRTPLYANAYFLMGRSVVAAATGFIFWAVAANFYSTEDVGLAAAVIAAAGLVGILSHFGLGFGLIRYLPSAGANGTNIINFTFTVSALVALTMAAIFMAGLDLWSPTLTFVRENSLFLIGFLFFAIVLSVAPLVDQAFVAKRSARYALIKSGISGSAKIIIVIFLAAVFGAFGIFAALGLATLLALIISLFFFLPSAHPGYKPLPRLVIPNWRGMFSYSLANYAADLIGSIPSMLYPLLVVNILGAEMNAYFYIAWMISIFFLTIPLAMSTSLFAEGSHDANIFSANARKSVKLSFTLLVPLVLLALLFGDKVLALFGAGYSENGTTLLWILVSSSLPFTINSVYIAQKRISKDLKGLVIISSSLLLLQLALSYPLMLNMGIVGIGIGVTGAQTAVAAVIIFKWLNRRRRS